ncbi:MAG TPA: ShlB/FhaC/HecB family hemolysin secretion/activation protein [Verrucomicrobiae bacterium]|nr:ShlB/FhaC/HecB family hemolysin secretion/activation protein [Verrucomicrobiae bacterium]
MNYWRHILILVVFVKCSAIAAQTTNSPVAKKNAPGLNISAYRIEGNSVLTPDNFGVLSNYTGTNISFPRLREGLGLLQLRYRTLGFPTISVTLPPQKPTNGVIRVKVVEGRLSQVNITGNKYFSTPNVLRAVPGLTTNILLNTRWFQPELDAANASRDRQIYPVISPGFEPGTTVLELKVKDRLPLHGRVEVNNKATPNTPALRLDTAVQYGNLWQREHQFGLDYNFSPQAFKDGRDAEVPLDSPMVASYSTFYRLPLGTGEGYREETEQQPATFGYDEVSHKFNLPPPSGHPDLTFYASRSASDTPLLRGPFTTIFTNKLAEIGSQFVQHSPTINNNIGVKLSVPVREFWDITSSLSLGLDFKGYKAHNWSTNQTIFNLYALDPFGNRVLVTNQVIPLAANSEQTLFYFPLSYGWTGSRPDPFGGFTASWNQSIFLQSLASARSDFQNVAGDTKAGGNYTTINAAIIRSQRIYHDWMATLNVNGQWASAPLISNEQIGLGGTSGVRGYEEGAAYGDTGWRALFDLHAPSVNIGYFATPDGDIPAELRCSLFMDYGQIFLLSRPTYPSHELDEWGTGLAFLVTIGEHVDARLTLAWALEGEQLGSARAYFSVGGQF